jgi:hypothetical protein
MGGQGLSVTARMSNVLTFDVEFHSDDNVLGCVLWADETVMGRVRFNIGRKILQDELDGENPVHGDLNVALCPSAARDSGHCDDHHEMSDLGADGAQVHSGAGTLNDKAVQHKR